MHGLYLGKPTIGPCEADGLSVRRQLTLTMLASRPGMPSRHISNRPVCDGEAAAPSAGAVMLSGADTPVGTPNPLAAALNFGADNW